MSMEELLGRVPTSSTCVEDLRILDRRDVTNSISHVPKVVRSGIYTLWLVMLFNVKNFNRDFPQNAFLVLIRTFSWYKYLLQILSRPSWTINDPTSPTTYILLVLISQERNHNSVHLLCSKLLSSLNYFNGSTLATMP